MSAQTIQHQHLPVVGIWTRYLIHPNEAPPVSYTTLKHALSEVGAVYQSEQRFAERDPKQTWAVAPEKRAVSRWTLGTATFLLREDGLSLLSEVTPEAAEILTNAVKKFQGDEIQTLSLAPLPPDWTVDKVMQCAIAQVLAPLDQGPFANGRFWSAITPAHDGPDLRRRFLQKQGIELPEEPKKKKKDGEPQEAA